ncbi:MAG: hypothetical protein SNJ57_09265 [Cyanobacteriota bacterium]
MPYTPSIPGIKPGEILVKTIQYSSQLDLMLQIWDIGAPGWQQHPRPNGVAIGETVTVKEGYGSPYRFASRLRQSVGSEMAEVMELHTGVYYCIGDTGKDESGECQVAFWISETRQWCTPNGH